MAELEPMKEMTMLDLDAIDLDDLCTALEDHSYDAAWWFDPTTGELHLRHGDGWVDGSDTDPEELGWLPVEPTPSHVGYGDMQDFIDAVPERRAAEAFARAIAGRGAFRRFKDALFDFPELRDQWFAFHDARLRRRAIEWLADNAVIDERTAEEAMAYYPDPAIGGPAANLPLEVAEDLRRLYRDRLKDVYVFGSRARGDAAEDSDLDLLVVLDSVPSKWAEHKRMDEILWRHTARSGIVVTAFPVDAAHFAKPDRPMLMRAKAEGRRVA